MKMNESFESEELTFLKLEGQEVVDPQDLIECLRDYVKDGLAIDPDVVIGIIKRTQLNDKDVEELAQIAQDGAESQAGGPRTQEEYKQIFDFIKTKQ